VSIDRFRDPTADLELLGQRPRLLAAHWVIDGHLSLPLLDKFIEYFVAEVEGKAEHVDELKWGEETKRLPPALVEAVAEKYRIKPAEPPVAAQPAPAPVRLAIAYRKVCELTRMN
jgi:hypothetical protein